MPKTLLVVDDQVLVRQMLAILLKQAGYLVATAGNGAEALDYIRQADPAPDAILLDLRMPIMDGWAFLQDRRTDAHCAAIPVIVLSAVSLITETDTAANLYALGVRAILPKAAEAPDLLDTIASVLAPTPLLP